MLSKGITYQEPNYPPYLDIDKAEDTKKATVKAELINKEAQGLKELIYLLKKVLSKDLPLQPYKDWIKKEEAEVVMYLAQANTITKGEHKLFSDIEIKKYEDIVVEHTTAEDIADFKNTGL